MVLPTARESRAVVLRGLSRGEGSEPCSSPWKPASSSSLIVPLTDSETIPVYSRVHMQDLLRGESGVGFLW